MKQLKSMTRTYNRCMFCGSKKKLNNTPSGIICSACMKKSKPGLKESKLDKRLEGMVFDMFSHF